MSDVLFDDPAGRTRFAWARTLMVAFVASLIIERVFFAGSLWSVAILVVPAATIGALTLIRSRPLRRNPEGVSRVVPILVVACVLLLAIAAMFGVVIR